MKYTKEQLNEKFQKLESSVQDVILSTDTAEAIKKISDKHNLHIDIAGQLNEEITFVMLGLNRASELVSNLKAQLNLPDEKVKAIAKDVNEQIFNKIRESLKQIPQEQSDISTDTEKTTSPLEIKKKDLEKIEEKIHHEPLTTPVSQAQASHVEEPISTPPSNLPTGEDAQLEAKSSGESEIPSNIAKEKLEKQVRIPKEEIDIDNIDSEKKEKKRPYSVDPYRETIE